MKRLHLVFLLPLGLTGMFFGCGPGKGSLTEQLAKANKAVFVGESAGKQGEVVVFEDAASLALLRGLVGGETSPAMKCGKDATLNFFAGADTVLSVSLTLQEGCHTASYIDGDSLKSVWLKGELDGLLVASYKTSLGIPSLEELSWMIGKWTQTDPSGAVSFETWTSVNENAFKGHSCTIAGKDTVFQEQLELIAEGQDIYYVATVEENEGPVRFKLIDLKANSALFENKAHDFPQMISYEALGDSGLHAKISGNMDGKYASVDFPLKKVK